MLPCCLCSPSGQGDWADLNSSCASDIHQCHGFRHAWTTIITLNYVSTKWGKIGLGGQKETSVCKQYIIVHLDHKTLMLCGSICRFLLCEAMREKEQLILNTKHYTLGWRDPFTLLRKNFGFYFVVMAWINEVMWYLVWLTQPLVILTWPKRS